MHEVAIRLTLEPLEDGGYVATSPDVPGLVAEGRTVTEVTELAQRLARLIVESCVEHGDPLPAIFAEHVDAAGLNLTVPVGVGWWAGSRDSGTRR
jgi:predicted RNase H-like HicB family nuclease